MIKRQHGVTLIELMVVVAIVAILAAIAYPSYRNQILRAHRAEAKAALLQVQVAQEKYALQSPNNSYATTDTLLATSPTATTPGLGIQTLSANGYYNISVVVAATPTATSYTASAIVTAKQADDTNCKAFTIDQTGARNSYNSTTSFSSSTKTTGCW